MEKALHVLQITMIMEAIRPIRKLRFLSIWIMGNNMDCLQSLSILLNRRLYKECKKWALEMYQSHKIVMTFMQVYTMIKLVNNRTNKNTKNSNMQRAIMMVIN